MFNERLARRLAIEDFLNQKSYQQVPMGALCSHTINKLIINGIHFNWKKILLEWVWIFTRVGIGSDAKLKQCKHLFLLSNETERGKSQFALIQPLMENKGGFFCW